MMKLTILGCGASAGVPIIGCKCSVCLSNNIFNKRTRASVVFENNKGHKLLIDATPDLRMQALNNNITEIDALLITHAHADHCHGIDDFRPFNFCKNAAIDLFATAQTMQELKHRFSYIFKEHKLEYGWYKPAFNEKIIDLENNNIVYTEIANMNIILFNQQHGKVNSVGIRVGDIAYSTDVNFLDETALQALKGVKIWVVDCLRYNPAPTHAHLNLTLEWIRKVNPQKAVLTHMAHEIDYDELCKILPENVEPAYDGMILKS